ncbi:MAG: prepilin-type N-terminal cleavage/methylation domain-containing protein [Halioglobus sp.]
MPRSVMGLSRAIGVATPAARRSRGFSLIELLVVLLVIGMAASLVSLSVGSGGQDTLLEAQVRNLADTAAYALDEAQFTGRDHGLLLEQVDDDGEWRYAWRWQARALDGWQAPPGEPEVFAEQRLPAGIALELEIENAPFSEVGLEDAEESRGPQVVLYASGETTVGAINVRRVQDGELLWRIEWDLLGRFQLLRAGQPLDEERDG